MAVLHLMVGLPGSGKTTWARAIAAETGAVRFTPDEWHIRLFGADFPHPDHDRRHDAVEAIMWDMAEVLLERGLDVILDFGFWSRAERDDFRSRAAGLGARCHIHYAAVNETELLARVAARNTAAPPAAFIIPEAMLRQWAAVFEPPTGDELEFQ
jgi:predicted kinase